MKKILRSILIFFLNLIDGDNYYTIKVHEPEEMQPKKEQFGSDDPFYEVKHYLKNSPPIYFYDQEANIVTV